MDSKRYHYLTLDVRKVISCEHCFRPHQSGVDVRLGNDVVP